MAAYSWNGRTRAGLATGATFLNARHWWQPMVAKSTWIDDWSLVYSGRYCPQLSIGLLLQLSRFIVYPKNVFYLSLISFRFRKGAAGARIGESQNGSFECMSVCSPYIALGARFFFLQNLILLFVCRHVCTCRTIPWLRHYQNSWKRSIGLINLLFYVLVSFIWCRLETRLCLSFALSVWSLSCDVFGFSWNRW